MSSNCYLDSVYYYEQAINVGVVFLVFGNKPNL